MLSKKLVWLVALAVAAGAIILAVKTAQKANKTYEITVGDAQQSVFALLYIAEAKGYFRDQKLNVQTRKFYLGRDALADVLAGNSDLATVYETPVVFQYLNGAPIKIVTTLHSSTKNIALVAAKDGKIKSLEDVRGKRIAVPKGSSAEVFLYLAMLNAGINYDEVTMVDTPPEKLIETAKSNTVDGVVAYAQYLNKMQQAFPPDSLNIYYSNVHTDFSVLAGKEDYVKSHGEEIKRLITALAQAKRFMDENPQEAIEIVSNRLGDTDGDLQKFLSETWGNYSYEMHISNYLATGMSLEAEWYKEIGTYQGEIPDFKKVFYPDYLREIVPEAVTI